MKRLIKREIETFELLPDYYSESWLNGNKTHVKEELSELFFSHRSIALSIIIELPKDIALKVVESEQFKDADLNISLAITGAQHKIK